MVNWEKGAGLPISKYFDAVYNAKITGQKLGEFIIAAKINPKKVLCIGHSLGKKAKTLVY